MDTGLDGGVLPARADEEDIFASGKTQLADVRHRVRAIGSTDDSCRAVPGDGVGASRAAEDCGIGARTSVDGIVPCQAGQDIGSSVAAEGVCKRGTDEGVGTVVTGQSESSGGGRCIEVQRRGTGGRTVVGSDPHFLHIGDAGPDHERFAGGGGSEADLVTVDMRSAVYCVAGQTGRRRDNENVIASTAVEGVITRVAVDDIVSTEAIHEIGPGCHRVDHICPRMPDYRVATVRSRIKVVVDEHAFGVAAEREMIDRVVDHVDIARARAQGIAGPRGVAGESVALNQRALRVDGDEGVTLGRGVVIGTQSACRALDLVVGERDVRRWRVAV